MNRNSLKYPKIFNNLAYPTKTNVYERYIFLVLNLDRPLSVIDTTENICMNLWFAERKKWTDAWPDIFWNPWCWLKKHLKNSMFWQQKPIKKFHVTELLAIVFLKNIIILCMGLKLLYWVTIKFNGNS